MPDDVTWYAALPAEEQAHIATKGWNALDAAAAAQAAVKAHFGAEKLIGHPADQTIKLPKDATDPSYQGIYDRVVGMSAPKTPEEYKFDGIKRKDGSELPAEDAAFVRDLAVKYKLGTAVAAGLAADITARSDGAVDTDLSRRETTKAANSAFLRQAWGTEFDFKSYAATRAAEAAGFSPSVLAHIATLPQEEYRANMDTLVALGQKMGEAALLRGGQPFQRDPTQGMTAADAQKRLDDLQADRAWGQKYLAHDADAVKEWVQLTTLVAAGRVPR